MSSSGLSTPPDSPLPSMAAPVPLGRGTSGPVLPWVVGPGLPSIAAAAAAFFFGVAGVHFFLPWWCGLPLWFSLLLLWQLRFNAHCLCSAGILVDRLAFLKCFLQITWHVDTIALGSVQLIIVVADLVVVEIPTKRLTMHFPGPFVPPMHFPEVPLPGIVRCIHQTTTVCCPFLLC